MKLLSVSMPQHDVNMSYFDARSVRYIKLERPGRKSGFALRHCWTGSAKHNSCGGTALDEVEEVFQLRSGCIAGRVKKSNGTRHTPPRKPGHLQSRTTTFRHLWLSGRKKAWFISHHYSHALSAWMLEAAPADLQIVIDGLGDQNECLSGLFWRVKRHVATTMPVAQTPLPVFAVPDIEVLKNEIPS